MLKVCAEAAVHCDRRPLIIQDAGFRLAHVDHWLNGQHHTFAQPRAMPANAEAAREGCAADPGSAPFMFSNPTSIRRLLDLRMGTLLEAAV